MFVGPFAARDENPKPKKDGTQEPRPWSKKPPKDWPQLVLTNEATFEGHTPLKGASAFLMRMSDGEILVATAKHLLGEEGGVKPTVRLANFDHVLKDWKVFPRTKPNLAIAAEGLGISGKREVTHDWLLIKLVHPKKKRSATPLYPRNESAKVGETAYLIGVSDSDEKTAQNVYKGKVIERVDKSYFTLQFDPPVKLAGFHGAPIIDQNGYVLGMMKIFLPSERPDGKQNQCWGVDASVAIDLWKQRSDKIKADPNAPIRLPLPPGWIEDKAEVEKVIKSAQNVGLCAVINLLAGPKERPEQGIDLMHWGRQLHDKPFDRPLEDRQTTDLKPVKLHGRDTVQYDVTGKAKGVLMHFRVILFAHKNHGCLLMCWAPEESWSKAESYFEDVFAAIE